MSDSMLEIELEPKSDPNEVSVMHNKRKRFWIIIGISSGAIAVIALCIGLGVGLIRTKITTTTTTLATSSK